MNLLKENPEKKRTRKFIVSETIFKPPKNVKLTFQKITNCLTLIKAPSG